MTVVRPYSTSSPPAFARLSRPPAPASATSSTSLRLSTQSLHRKRSASLSNCRQSRLLSVHYRGQSILSANPTLHRAPTADTGARPSCLTAPSTDIASHAGTISPTTAQAGPPPSASNYDPLVAKAALHGAKLLKKHRQATAEGEGLQCRQLRHVDREGHSSWRQTAEETPARRLVHLASHMSWKEATAGESVENQEQGPNPDNQNGLKAASLLGSRSYVLCCR